MFDPIQDPMAPGRVTTERPQCSNAEDLRLKRACQDFESLFLAHMMKAMRKTLPESGLFGDGLGGSHFSALFDEELAARISRTKGVGLAEILHRELMYKARSDTDAKPGAQEKADGFR